MKAIHRPWLTPLLALPALVLIAAPGLGSATALDRSALLGGQWWRLFSGHWAHFDVSHLVWSLATFVVIAAVLEMLGLRKRMLVALAIGAPVIGLGVFLGLPGIADYRGLSGLDCALVALLAAETWRRARSRGDGLLAGAVLLTGCGFVAKLGFEMATGGGFFVDTAAAGFDPVPLAHLLGAAAGLVAALPMPRPPIRGAALVRAAACI